MKIATNFTALLAQENDNLKPGLVLEASRKAHDDFAKGGKPADMDWTEFSAKVNALMFEASRQAKRQYYPILKRMVAALLKDWKLTCEDTGKTCAPQYRMDGSMSLVSLQPWIVHALRPHLTGKFSELNVLNIIKPGISKALRELEEEQLVLVNHPSRRQWGGVCTYLWVLPGNYDEKLVKAVQAWQTCEKCGKHTRLTIDVCGRTAAWCGCGN
jgi:hypothetical protein